MSGSAPRASVPSRRRGLLAVAATLVTCSVVLALVLRVGPRAASPRSDAPSARTLQPSSELPCAPSELLAPVPPPSRDLAAAPVAPTSADPAPDVAAPTAPVLAGVLGRVVRADGSGAVDMTVVLDSSAGGAPQRAACGLDGTFQLAGIPAGEHRLSIGEGAQPFLAALPVQVEAPTTLLDDIVLPELGTLELRVVDELGQAVPDARVTCLGHPRGHREAISDAEGRARFADLPSGEGRVHAQHEQVGRGNLPFALEGGTTTPLEVVLIGRGADVTTTAAAQRERASGRRGTPR